MTMGITIGRSPRRQHYEIDSLAELERFLLAWKLGALHCWRWRR